MKNIATKHVLFSLLYLCVALVPGCKPNSDTPTTVAASQPDNIYAYSLITEDNGWHILRKDSFMTTLGVNNWPADIFFANNSIYYETGVYSGGAYATNNYFYKNCTIDGNNAKHVVFPFQQSYANGSIDLPFVFDGSTTLYNYSATGYLYQQQLNTDGTSIGSPTVLMGYNYFAGKFRTPSSFSSTAQCFIGNGYGFTDVVEVQNKVVKPYLWAIPGRSDIPFNPTTVFDESFSKANPKRYRVFGASIGRDNAHTYYNNPCDIAVHCLMDTAKATNFSYPSTYYAKAILMDTIHYESTKYVTKLATATDDQNLYVLAINMGKTGTILPTSLIVYDKSNFTRKKYFQNIVMPSTISPTAMKSTCKMITVPSKNYLAILLAGNQLVKLDISTGNTSEITPTLPSGVLFGGGFFENNGRIYSQVAGRTSASKDYCSNIIYFE
ncbi:MAG TPA: hypothetical protein VJ552_03415 [Sediminibacterium sp.]|nr:hypothetical protein [Sediminibacterium sp.]